MKIAFNPSTVAALTAPPNNKDITFDLRGRNIFARGVKFYGTDTNTWRDIKINNVSISSHTLDLRNGSNTTLSNTNGVVTINSTWRPVVDNLTSNSTTSSLSANQGRVLAGLINTLSTNISNQYALRNGSNATGRWAGGLACFDVRNTNYTPHDLNMGLELLFLRNSTNNLKDGGEYNGVFSFRQWSSGSDWSGGKAHQLSFTDNGNVWHRTSSGDDSWGAWKKLAYSTDIPSSVKNPYSLTTFGVIYDGSATKIVNPSNFISQLEEGTSVVTDGTMFVTSWASDKGFADTNAVNVPYKRKAARLWDYIKTKTDSLYTVIGHTHDDRYLRLIGGTMTGTINRRSGGSTISGRDRAIIRQTHAPGGSSWNPIACVDTETGTWTLGHLSSGSSNTDFSFCFSTNADYNAGNNAGNYVTLRNRVGTIALTSEIPSKGSWNYDDRYYTKAESNAKYITDITTSVNKLTFTKNGSSIARTITVNNVQSLGKRSPLTERNAISGIYTYGTYSATDNLAPYNYFETLGFGEGAAGTIEIGGSWISGGKLYWRALRDCCEDWFSWKTILDSSNYSGILDSRYYTESEVNSLLSKKLDRVNLSVGTWNPRGYNLAADYYYNGGDLSISENGGKMYVSIDGQFYQNEGQYRVLDTSDIGSIRGGLTLYQHLSATDANWYPLVWGGDDHKNTNNSTGSLYKSYDKLSWQTSSQTLYTTHLRTTYIDLENSRGISQVTSKGTSPYKGIRLPDLQSNGIGMFSKLGDGNGADEGGIIISADTSVIYNSFDTGWGLSVRDKDRNQMDISGGGTIAFGVRADYRAYSLGGFEKSGSNNSYVLLGGGSHKLESALNVANADTVDGYHYNNFTYKKYIGYNRNGPYNTKVFSRDISSLTWDASYLIFDIFSSGYKDNRVYFGRYEVSLGHWNNTDKNPTVYSRWIFKTSSAYDCVHVVKDLSSYKVDVYIENSLWDCSMGLSIVANEDFNMLPANSWVNLPSASNNIQIINTTYLTFVGNSSSATKLQTARKLWGQSFDGTADVSGTLSGVANIQFSANNAYDIGSNSAASRYIYTHWLGARTGQKLELGANNSGFGQGLCIDTNLNVGIGTNTPSYKLDVRGDIGTVGDIYIHHSASNNMNYNTSNPRIVFSENGSQAVGLVYTDYDSYRASKGLKVMDVDNSEASNVWLEVQGYNYSSGYVKNGSSNSYVLLGGGDHKAENSLNVASADKARALKYTGTGNSEITAYQTDASYMGRSGWASYIICNHGSGSTYYSQTIAFPFWSSPIYRRLEGGTDRGWKKFYTEENPPSWDNVTNKPSSFTPSSHTHSWASITDKIVAGNEFNIVNAGFKEGMWFNYLPINDRSKTATISSYHFGNGAKGYASIVASGFIKSGGNASQLLRADGGVAAFNWSGQAGQPTWLWGGNSQHSYYVYNPSNFRVAYAASADNSDKVDGYHATDGRTFNGNINWSSNWNTTWSDGTNKHPWYGFDHRYPNTGAYSTTISDYFGMTIKTANTLRLDCKDLLINGTNISNLNVASATNAYHLRINSANSWSTWYWAGQGGQPSWLWGSNDGTNMYVWNPSNFKVAYATSAGNADTVDGKHASDFAPASHTHGYYAVNENYGGFKKAGRLPTSGFYQSYESESGGNAPWSSWMHLINCQHSNTSNNYALQIAASFYDNNTFKIRVTNDNVNNAWQNIIHSGNIGSQSVAYASKAGSVAWSNVTGRPTIPNPTDYYWANIKVSASSNTQTKPSVNTIYANNWFRSQGASGWYSESYGGGIHMSDTTWIRTYGDKPFYCNKQIYSSDSIRMGDIYLQNKNEINNGANGDLYLNYRNTGDIILCNGGGKVGIGKSDPLYKLDVAGNGRFQDFVYCNAVYSNTLNHTSPTGYLIIGNKTKEISIRSSYLPDVPAVYLYQKFSTNVYYTANKGFGIRPYYLSSMDYRPTETISGNTYSVVTVGDSVQAISCIIADKANITSQIRGTLIRFLPGDDGQIVLLKDLNNYGATNGYFYVQPKGCNIIGSNNSNIHIADGNISDACDDGKSRFFIYAKTHKVWIEFYCG